MSFTALINANVTGFSQGVDKASKDIEKLEKDVSERLAKVGDKFLSIGKSASVFSGAIAAAATGVFMFSKRAGDMASDLLSATVALDSSADMLQEYEFIASQAGTSTEAFSRGVEAMTRRLKDAGNEGDNTSQLINGLGVAMNNADGSMRRTGDIANDLILSLAEMSNVSERNVIASQLFGRAWVDIAPILDGGADGIEGVRAKAHELGLVLDGDALNGMANFSIEANRLGMQFSAIGNNLASQFAPLLSETIVPLIENTVIPAVQGLADKVGVLITWFQELSGPAQETVLAITGVAAAFGPVMLGIGGVLKLLPLLKAGFIAATGPIGLIVAAVAGAAVLIIKHWDEIKAYFTTGGGTGIFDTVMETVNMLKGFFSKVFQDIKTAVLYIWDTMGGDLIRIMNNVISSIVIVIETIIKTFRNVVKILTSIFRGDFKGALDGLKNLFRDVFTGIGQLVTTALSNIASGVAGFFRLIGLDGIADSISRFAEKLSPPVIEFGKTVDDTTEKVEDLTEAIDAIPAKKEIAIVANITSGAIELGEVANPVGGLLGNVGQDFDSMIEDINTRAAASMDALQTTLGEKMNGIKESVGIGMVDLSALLAQGVTGLADSIGTAFATGDWDNMGNELLAAIGGLAQQFGATLISMGTAALALRILIKNPFTAIAAGIALVALGAAATAAASKQVSAATGGGSGGGGGGSTGYRDTASPGQSEYRGAWKDDFRVEFVQKGSDLVGVLDVAEQRRRRS